MVAALGFPCLGSLGWLAEDFSALYHSSTGHVRARGIGVVAACLCCLRDILWLGGSMPQTVSWCASELGARTECARGSFGCNMSCLCRHCWQLRMGFWALSHVLLCVCAMYQFQPVVKQWASSRACCFSRLCLGHGLCPRCWILGAQLDDGRSRVVVTGDFAKPLGPSATQARRILSPCWDPAMASWQTPCVTHSVASEMCWG
jgi:hypothetical protein